MRAPELTTIKCRRTNACRSNLKLLTFYSWATSPTSSHAKTAVGIAHWRPDSCVAQFRLPGSGVDLGLPDMTPAEAAAAGARSLIWGVAGVGGIVPKHWIPTLFDAVDAGLDIVAGTHSSLTRIPGLADAAEKAGVSLIDIRKPPADLPVGTGVKRSGRRLLMVGTDCVVGKKFSALAIAKEMIDRGMNADFRATGQTGIMISGGGMPIDAVVSDFVSGAAEVLSPDNADDHWDVIEGQGSLYHPGYAAVTLGLMHGSQPDAFVVCHEAGRTMIEAFSRFSDTRHLRTNRTDGCERPCDESRTFVVLASASIPPGCRTGSGKATSGRLLTKPGYPALIPSRQGSVRSSITSSKHSNRKGM